MKKQVVELVFIFVFTFLYCIVISNMHVDEMWSFSFSFNIVDGLIPYSDYNMVIGPFFPVFNAILLFIFGNSMLVYNIIGSLIGMLIFLFMKQNGNNSCYISYAILLLIYYYGYSTFTLLILYILMYLETKEKNDYLIGMLLGVLIITKLNIGIFLIIPTLFTKDFNKILKRALSAEIVVLLSFLIMLLMGNFSEFLNYSVLGLFEFGAKNTLFSVWGLLTIGSILILLYFYFIRKDKDIRIIYILCFQIMAYPIFDTFHCLIAMIPALGYALNKLKLHYKTTLIAFIILIVIMLIVSYIEIKKDNMKFYDDSVLFKYRFIDKETFEGLKTVRFYIEEKQKTHKVFVFDKYAYIYKIEANKPIDKFDLINYGNIGYNGSAIYIDEINSICEKEDCIFLMDYRDIDLKIGFFQTNQEILTYVVDNYSKIDNLYFYEIYGDSNE